MCVDARPYRDRRGLFLYLASVHVKVGILAAHDFYPFQVTRGFLGKGVIQLRKNGIVILSMQDDTLSFTCWATADGDLGELLNQAFKLFVPKTDNTFA